VVSVGVWLVALVACLLLEFLLSFFKEYLTGVRVLMESAGARPLYFDDVFALYF